MSNDSKYVPTTPLGTEGDHGISDDESVSEMSRLIRSMWDGHDVDKTEIEASMSEGKTCRNMKHMDFADMVDSGTDVATAWREKLRLEGKWRDGGSTLGSLIAEMK